MKKRGLQELVKSIISDESVCSRFADDPQSILSEYNLSDAEQKAVLNPRLKLALVTGESETITEFGILESWF
jgi:hypothetical protein